MKNIIEKLGITPGPWFIKTCFDELSNYGFVSRKREIEKGVPHSSIWIEGAYDGDNATDESKANDLLIASAPEMFLWIIGMMESADSGDMVKAGKLLLLGNELIKKATGKTLKKIKEL